MFEDVLQLVRSFLAGVLVVDQISRMLIRSFHHVPSAACMFRLSDDLFDDADRGLHGPAHRLIHNSITFLVVLS